MGPFAAAALSFGASFIGGQLSRETAKKERKDHFVNLRDSATRAGFNPLTALYATGGGGYGQYVGLISRNPMGDAIVAGSNAYTAGAARREQMAHDRSMQSNRFAQENSLQKMRLDHDKRMNALLRKTVSDGYPETDRSNSIQIKPPKLGRPNPQGRIPNYIAESLMVGEEKIPPSIRINDKFDLQVDRNVSSVEVGAEARYGDLGGSILGLNVLWQDFKKSMELSRATQKEMRKTAAEAATYFDYETGQFGQQKPITLSRITRPSAFTHRYVPH